MSKSTVETLEEGLICSKLTITIVERCSRFARVQIECHNTGFKQNLPVQSQKHRH